MSKIKRVTRENEQYLSNIDSKYEVLVSNILCYVKAELNSVHAELAINEISKALNEAQDKGEDLNEVAKDYKAFTTRFTSRFNSGNFMYGIKSLICDYLPVGVYAIVFFLIADMISTIYGQGARSFETILKVNYPLKPAIYLGVLLTFLALMYCIKKITKVSIISEGRKATAVTKNIVIFIILAAILIGSSLFITKLGILNIVSFTVKKSAIAIGISVILVLIFSIVSKTSLSKR